MTSNSFESISLTATEIDRFFSKTIMDDVDPLRDCWVWTGSKNTGYGQVSIRRVSSSPILCHRLTYAWLVDSIPGGKMDLHHRCKNPACCNPWHLVLISHRDHTLISKGSIAYVRSRLTHCKNGHPLPPKIAGKSRRCPICHEAWKKAYNIKHQSEIRAKSRQNYMKNRDQILAKSRENYAANPDKFISKSQSYYASHREEILARSRAPRAKKRRARLRDSG